MITGFTLEQQIQQALQEGSYACLNKPYNVEKLLDVVDKCLSDGKRKGKTP
jgi:DNA-binding NtrC family response regulator